MSRTDWHLLGLVAFVSPLVVTGLGAAISRGHGPAAVMATVVGGALLAGYLSRHRSRDIAPRSPREHDDDHADAGTAARAPTAVR